MTPDQDIGRRAAACKGWRWMPGMLDLKFNVRVVVAEDGIHRSFDTHGEEAFGSTDPLVPDLRDPATLGCLLALVREAWNEPSLSLCPIDESVPLRWAWVDGGLAAPMCDKPIGYAEFTSEAAALVAALEAAP